MFMQNVSLYQLGIIVLIVLVIFGTKRLRQAGGDIGAMISGFKKEVKTEDLIETAQNLKEAAKEVKDFTK
jgi:sec-independent protein translocase protein TatA